MNPERRPSELRIALVSDIHYGPAVEAKAGERALPLLERVLGEVATSGADLLVELGDRVNNAGAAEDRRNMVAVAQAFSGLSLERHHLLGNHDVKLVDAGENAAIMAAPVGSRVLRRQGWNLILWSPPPVYHRDGCLLPRGDVAWLEETLGGLDGPAVLFSHVPLGGGGMAGNYYFEGGSERGAAWRDMEALRELVLESGYLKAALAGHIHANTLNVIDGVPFLTLQSLSELATTHPEPAGAWAVLRLSERELELDVKGLEPWRTTLPLRPDGRRWLRRPGTPQRGPRPAPCTPASARGVILDLDGVVYRGGELLPGAAEFVTGLRAAGKRLLAVSNHSGATAAELRAKLARLGVELAADEVLTSTDAAVAYLAQRMPGATVLPVGCAALAGALAAAGFTPWSGAGVPDAVVVGFQTDPAAATLVRAAEAIEAGAVFIGTNADDWLPGAAGRGFEAGPWLALLAGVTRRKPIIVGKPDFFIAGLALERLGLPARDVLVVGDTLETDIALAHAAGCSGALVLTGNARREDLLVPRPDFVFDDLVELGLALNARGSQAPAEPLSP